MAAKGNIGSHLGGQEPQQRGDALGRLENVPVEAVAKDAPQVAPGRGDTLQDPTTAHDKRQQEHDKRQQEPTTTDRESRMAG